ncbi:MAG: ribbon-helix-helix domain-containing protein [Roseburia sp.]|nr:ribbon-helix-helix domain-containing protein [Roseburia sp.]
MAKKKSKKRFTKSCKAGITKEMWMMLTEMKIRLNMSKARIIREALREYYERNMSDVTN